MISKKVPREQPGPFKDLALYLKTPTEEGEKLDQLWIEGCAAGDSIDDLDMAIREVEAQQALNPRVKTDKQYHLVVSFRADRPSAEILRDIERNFAKAMGFADHPRVVATHQNTENYHMHVAYSRIHPETLRAHAPKWDFLIREKVCRAMEKKHGLKVDLGREDKLEPSPLPQPARDMEAHTWEQSFAGYVQEHKPQLMKGLDQAKTWQDLHKAFGKYDLVLRKRGNGLVIGNRPTNQHTKAQHVKASSLDRSFSKAALEKRFGPFQRIEKSAKTAKPLKRYERRPVTRHPRQARLWRQYIGQRRHRESLAVKAFKTWRDFLMYGIDDPLAMAIVVFHKNMIEAALGASPSAPRPSLSIQPTVPTPQIDAGLDTSQPQPNKSQKERPRVFLKVPFEDKNLVKDLGAKWDTKRKSWFVPENVDPEIFTTWSKDRAAGLDRTEVEQDQAEGMGAFQEDALTPDDFLESHHGLDSNGRPTTAAEDPQKPTHDKKRDQGMEK